MRLKKFVKAYAEDIILALAAVAVIFLALLYGGSVGLSDNGDFRRVMEPNGISFTSLPDERSFVFNNKYHMSFSGSTPVEKIGNLLFSIKNPGHYPSIQHAFIKIAMAANIAINYIGGHDLHIFRIEVLGAIYAFIYGFSLFLLLTAVKPRNRWLRLIIKIILIIAACDMGYIIYFNSFYGEGLQTIFLIFALAFGLKLLSASAAERLNIISFFLSLIAYAWSKFANIPVACLCVLLCIPGLCVKKSGRSRLFISAAAGVALFVMVIIYMIVPEWMDNQTNYNSVFFGVLRDADAAVSEQYVKELGLPPYMSELADTNYYMKRVAGIVKGEEFVRDFSKISKTDIAVFYLKNPGYFMKKLVISAANSGMIRPAYLSNYGANVPRLTFRKRFELWGELRKKLPFDTIWWNAVIITLFIVSMLFCGVKERKARNRRKFYLYIGFGAALTAGALFNLCIPVITNGEGDIAKHMFAFIQFIDMMSMVLAAALIETCYEIFVKSKAGDIGLKRPVIAVAAVVSIILSSWAIGFAIKNHSKPNFKNSAAKGSYIEYGSYDGQNLVWQVVASGEGELTLMCGKTVGTGAFSETANLDGTFGKYGNNLWSTSKIRYFLNNEFLDGFTEKEKELLLSAENRFPLSTGHVELKIGGDNEFFWSHVPKLADRGYERAYYSSCADKVFAPDIRLVCGMYNDGLGITRDRMYWLSTPYYNNDSMVRIVDADGYIYMRDAVVKNVGILPALKIKSGFKANGEGSIAQPFKIFYK